MDTNGKVNILLVDDQPAKLISYEVILAELGENLIKAGSGGEALRRLLQTDVAVVVMDVCMPDLDGFELAKMIREHPRLANTAIILVSAVFLTDLDRLRGYHSGAVDYVPVPIIPEVLRAKVRVFADLYRKTRDLRILNAELERRVSERTADLQASTARAKKSEERFRFLAETIPSMVWIAAPDGTITYANQRWLEYRGTTAEPQRPWPELEVHPEDRDAWITVWQHGLESGGRFEVEARHRRHDGTYRWFLTRGAPRREPDGELICWFGVTTDIDDQKQMQLQLRDADRKKDEFLAVLSHELRNPLSPIKNAVHLLRLRTGDDPELVWCRDVIERQTQALTRLVDDLLDVSRISSGKVRLKKEPMDLVAVITEAVESNRPLIDARGHALVVECPDAPLPIDGDPMRLAQVFGNLINNAAKYTEKGGRITVRVTSGKLADGTSEVVVRVVDSGLGIPAGMLPLVFDMFTQGDRSLEQEHGGLGIGLALVRSLVGLHGGTVEAHSDGAGRGSEFVVRLPVHATPGATANGTPAPARAAGSPKPIVPRTVLVVDDNIDSADCLAILLRNVGHEVHTANDGVAGLAAAERLRPDVVLMDLGMPRMNGYEAARRIREQEWGKHMVLIAQTGWGQDEDRRRTAETGFDLHLTKPVDAPALLQIIAALPTNGAPVRS